MKTKTITIIQVGKQSIKIHQITINVGKKEQEMIGRIKEWDNIYNFEFTNLIVTSRLYPFLLIIQIVWLLFIVHKIFKNKNSISVFLNLFIFQFTLILLFYIHYINKLKTALYEFRDSLKFSFEVILIAENRWLTFFSYELILALLNLFLALYYILKLKQNNAD